MRAFSTIEILIALAILTTTITAVALVAFGTPYMLANMKMETITLYHEDSELARIEHLSWRGLMQIHSIASTTRSGFEESLSISSIEDGVSIHAQSNTSWIDSYDIRRSSTLKTLLTDTSGDNPCDPFVSSTWSLPYTHVYSMSVGDLLPAYIPADSYPVADLKTTGNTLIAAVRATTQLNSPTLFFFDISKNAQKPTLLGNGFDNASTSRIGFVEVATGNGYAYAANGFGSASPQTCAGTSSCAQVQIFSLPSAIPATFITSLSLATTSAPYALSSGNGTAPASAITYSQGRIYLGLQKTIAGDEFNIIDVSDPLKPRWISGMPIGRTVNHIVVRNGFAYVATDDNVRELMIFDVRDSEHPVLAGSWDAPGSTGFGFGTALIAHASTTLLGRSYVSNAPEVVSLNTDDPTHITQINTQDIGTVLNPDSIRGFISQDFLTYALTTKKLQFWNYADTGSLSEFAPPLSLPSGSTGTSVACRENTLYVGLEQTSQASGSIEVVTGTNI
ncbi:hypothetical protein BH11PAT2_BH11PAT2_06570 [soil metagenome]